MQGPSNIVTHACCGKVTIAVSGNYRSKPFCWLKAPQLLLKSFFIFQSETSFNLISEKCDILSILRDHPENRIYQRKIQVRQRVNRRGFYIQWTRVGSREDAALKAKRLSIWTRSLGKLKCSENILMLGICLSEKSFSGKKKKTQFLKKLGTILQALYSKTSLQHPKVNTFIIHIYSQGN